MDIEITNNIDVVVRCHKCGQCMDISDMTCYNGEKLEIELHEHECEE